MTDKPEIMCRRTTADGKAVQFWDDGVVTTGLLAVPVKGAGKALDPRPMRANLAACWLLAGEVELYEWRELPQAVKAARLGVRNNHVSPLRYFRQMMSGKRMVCHLNALGSVAAISWKEVA